MPRIKLYVNTGFANAKHVQYYDYPDDEWNKLTEKEKEKELDTMANEYLSETIDYGAIVEEG